MKLDWLQRSCPLCGSSRERRVFAESNIDPVALDEFAFSSRKLPEYMHGRLVECQCGMLYANPVLSPDTLAGAYSEAAFDNAGEAYYASLTYASHVSRLLPSLPNLHGALDIGTGDGAFLEQLLRLGFQDVAGVEPSKAPVAAAKPNIRPLIRLGLFRAEDLPLAPLSLVSCFQTMEHVWDPLRTVRQAYDLLKPGGALIIVVHNRRSVSARLLGMKSPIIDIEHLQLFCPSTARLLLQSGGFRNITVSVLWNRYPLHYWTKLLPIPVGIKRPLLGILRQSFLGRIPLAIPPGNLICFGFK